MNEKTTASAIRVDLHRHSTSLGPPRAPDERHAAVATRRMVERVRAEGRARGLADQRRQRLSAAT